MTSHRQKLPMHERLELTRYTQASDRIVKFLAIATKDCLNEKVQAPVRSTGNFRSIPAFTALEVIRPAHSLRRFAEVSLPCPAEKLNPEFWPMQRACVGMGMAIGYGPV